MGIYDPMKKKIINSYIDMFKKNLDYPSNYNVEESKEIKYSNFFRKIKGTVKSVYKLEKTVIDYSSKMCIALVEHKDIPISRVVNILPSKTLKILGYIHVEMGHIPEDSDDDRYLSVELKTTIPLRIDGITVPKFKIITSNKNDPYHFETHVLIKDGKDYVRQNNFNHIINKHKVLNL